MWTYFIQSGQDGPIKIGKAKDPETRLKELQTGSPDTLRLIGKMNGDHEAELHARFHSLHMRGEWFQADLRLIAFIRERAESVGQLDALISVCRELVDAYHGMSDEFSELSFELAVKYGTNGKSFPKIGAFHHSIYWIEKHIKELAINSRSNQGG